MRANYYWDENSHIWELCENPLESIQVHYFHIAIENNDVVDDDELAISSIEPIELRNFIKAFYFSLAASSCYGNLIIYAKRSM